MKIRFTYSVSRGGLQLHDQEAILEVEGDPDQGDRPSLSQLLKAEHEFRSRFDDPRQYLDLVPVGAGGRLERPV